MNIAMKETRFYQSALEWVRKRGYNKVKANVDMEGVEPPTSFKQEADGEESLITPDITATMRGNKCYFEIAVKTDEKTDLITKWKLLDRLASIREGKFFLFTPHGHRAFADRIIRNHEINATLVNI